MQKAVLEAEGACVIPGSSKRVSVAPVCSYRVVDFLNSPELIFGFIFMFLFFLIYLELFLGSSACVDLFGRLVSVVSACLFVSVWTSVRY